MAKDHRQRKAGSVPGSVNDVIVAMAGASGANLDQDFVVLRSVDGDVFDTHRGPRFVENSCAHRTLLSRAARACYRAVPTMTTIGVSVAAFLAECSQAQ